MSLGIKVWGPMIVLKGIGNIERSESGAVTQTLVFEGVSTAIQQFALNLPLGNRGVIQNNGPISQLSVTLGLSASDARWELDVENLQQDILKAAFLYPPGTTGGYKNSISAAARAAFISWRNGSILDSDVIRPIGNSVFVNGDVGFLASLQSLWLQGVETIPANALILKLTATFPSVSYPSVISVAPSLATTIYTSQQLIDKYNPIMYPGLPALLPGSNNGSQPLPDMPETGGTSNKQWGWRPRQVNATFIGKGQLAVQNDWEFAAWDTRIYTLATP